MTMTQPRQVQPHQGTAQWQQPRMRTAGGGRRHPRCGGGFACRAAPAGTVPFPSDYNEAVRQAQGAVKAALEDGHRLLEVEFPTASLRSVAGDAEAARPA